MSTESEEQIFQIKTKFLREIPHPKLIWKAIEQTNVDAINLETEKDRSKEISSDQFSDLLSFLKVHTTEILKIKLEIANSISHNDLHLALKDLYYQQWSLIDRLSDYITEETVNIDSSLKMSDPIDAYLLTKFLETDRLSENEIKTYICTSISNKPEKDFDVLTIACLRSRKIKVNAGSV